MSAFLKDLPATDGKVTTDLFDKVSLIKNEIITLKSLTNDSMKDKYIELAANLKPDKILLHKSEQLVQDMENLQSRINDQIVTKLTSSSNELQNLSIELKEYNYSLHLSSHLLKIYQAFNYIESFNNSNKQLNGQYSTVAKIMVELQELVIEQYRDIQLLNNYVVMKEEYFKLHNNFTEELVSLWHKNIYWSDQKDTFDENIVSLSVKCPVDELMDLVQALFIVKKLQKYVELLSIKLLRNFISSIINCECLVNNTDNSFSIKILNKKQVPPYRSVFDNLKIFFEFVKKHFEISVDGEKNLLSQISNIIFSDFSNLLTTNCIFKILPTSTAEIETFKNIVLEVDAFQNYLLDIKFITEEQKFLTNYTNNIDELYIEKKIEKLLETARNIMKKDLHDSISYKQKSLEEHDCITENVMEDYESITLCDNFFHFPKCQISKSAQEIICLVEEILEEGCQNPEKYLPKLFYTTRNIFEMYANLVPEIHKSYLETIPQQVALFHNNCLYLSHNLLTLAFKYQKKITPSCQEFSLIYADQVLLLREVGYKYFLSHLKYQRDTILDILRESGLTTIGQMPELPASTERALRQCIRQLELLKTVWTEILPIKVFYRVMGCIINNMIDDIIAKVISVEDIPANVASELVTLFNMLLNRIPQIFSDPQSIERYVQRWKKLKELIIILGASLKEIEDRWADGKGPLAKEFLPQHVKQLIRALFQNTERRSHLLSRIKEKS